MMASLVPEKDIEQVQYLIESGQLVRALHMISILQSSKYQSSASVLALKALAYAKTGLTSEALSICENLFSDENYISADTKDLLQVLNTLQKVCYLLGKDDLATAFYNKACSAVPNDLDLMKGLFYCYQRQTSFENQLEISLRMYEFSGRPVFLFWSVFNLQLQACFELLTKHMKEKQIDEPETLLVYVSVTEQQAKNNVGILSKLGPTLLEAQVARQCIKRVKLLTRVSDYTAAAEFLREYLKSRHSDGMLDLFEPHAFLHACKLSQSSKDEMQYGSEMSKLLNCADLLSAKKRCLAEREPELDEAVNEYFNRHESNARVCLEVFTKEEEVRLIANHLDEKALIPNALQESLLAIRSGDSIRGRILPTRKHLCHGTSIAIKTNNFIILAADGTLTSEHSYRALGFKTDKLMNFDDMCIALTGDWKNFSRMRSTLCRCIRFLKDNGKGRPPVTHFANFVNDKLFSRVSGTEILFGAFDRAEDGQLVPCICYVDEDRSYEIEKLFFCAGTGRTYAKGILSDGNVNEEMKLDEAISLVERALAFANMCDAGCTGGWASIHVIKADKTITTMRREHISSTLWRRIIRL